MLHQTRLMFFRRHLPKLFQTEAEFLRLALRAEREMAQQGLGQIPARAFGKERVFCTQFHAAREAVLRLSVLADAHVAGSDAGYSALVVIQDFCRSEAWIDFHTRSFRLG